MRLRPVLVPFISFLLAGCGTMNYAEYEDVHNLTPELESLAKSDVGNDVTIGTTMNQNRRMLFDDLMRAFYTDQPTALTPYPIVKTSGTPR